MSKRQLKKELNQLLERLKKDSSEFRKLVSNKKAHYINFKESELRQQIYRSLINVAGYKNVREIPEGMKKVVDEGVADMFDKFVAEVRAAKKKMKKYQVTDDSPIKGGKGFRTFSFVFATSTGTDETSSEDVFTRFKKFKQDAQRDFIVNLNTQLKAEGRLMKEMKRDKETKQMVFTGKMVDAEFGKNNFLDLGHVGESAVARQRNAMVQDTLLDISSRANTPALTAFLKQLEGSVALIARKKSVAKTNGGKEVVEIKFESAGDNRGEDLSMFDDLNKDLEKAILQLIGEDKDGIMFTSMSSDYLENIEEGVLHRFGKMPGKKNFKQKKPKPRKKEPVSIEAGKMKATKGRGFTDKSKAGRIKPGAQQEENRESPINLMVLINSKLPQTVLKNMGAPRLENRTGTFASSVRAVDASRTPQGFPSIGYTYQRQPYGVFEASSGSRFASVDRDPRTLIDASIREIAAQLVTGRLYTRRV
tara:strand:- start:484 stop:1914 length:1431 start_codon:yes stop_codon:yes gene_type:complete